MSYRGRVFTGQMTQPTVSKHWRKMGSKDQVSIPSGPPYRAHNNTTNMQYEKQTHRIHRDKHKWIYAQWKGAVRQNPIQRTVTAHLIVLTLRSTLTSYCLIISTATATTTSSKVRVGWPQTTEQRVSDDGEAAVADPWISSEESKAYHHVQDCPWSCGSADHISHLSGFTH